MRKLILQQLHPHRDWSEGVSMFASVWSASIDGETGPIGRGNSAMEALRNLYEQVGEQMIDLSGQGIIGIAADAQASEC
jgi:hypothetical protein